MSEKTLLLDAKNVNVRFGKTQIVNNISLQVRTQQIVALLGPNGAGKTTLMHALAGLSTPSESTTISFDNNVITDWRPDQRVTAGLVFMPQQSALFRALSVMDNLAVVYDYHPFWRNKTRSEFNDTCQEYFELTSLTPVVDRKAGLLSGGQKRKLELIRALLMHPRLIICDEPFAGVDPKSIYELRELFCSIIEKQKVSVMISDHNVEQLMEAADYLYMVLDGKIMAQGTMHDILADPTTCERYFGPAFTQLIKNRLKK